MARVHPFRDDRVTGWYGVGHRPSLKDIVADIFDGSAYREMALGGYAVVYIGDTPVPIEWWSAIFPKPGAELYVRILPGMGGGGEGGGGKSPLKTVLTLAVMAAAFYFAPGLGVSIGSSLFGVTGPLTAFQFAVGKFIAGAAISLVGNMIVSAIAPPPSQSAPAISNAGFGGSAGVAESPTHAITGIRNQANLFGPIPKVYGKRRIFPVFGAVPYTELVGDDQFINAVFVVGYGPLDITEMKIGETALSSFSDVETVIREEYDPAVAPLNKFRNDVFEESIAVPLEKDGIWAERTTNGAVDEGVVEIVFPRGLFHLRQNGTKTNEWSMAEFQRRLSSSPTNYLIRSHEFDNAAWTKTNVSVAANTVNDPNSLLNGGDLVEDSTAAGVHKLAQVSASFDGSKIPTLTFSAFVYRRAGGRNVMLTCRRVSSDADRFQGVFNLGAGTAVDLDAAGTATIVSTEISNAGGGWYLVSVTGDLGVAEGSMIVELAMASGTTVASATYTGDGASSLAVFGAQLFDGVAPRSYMPTSDVAGIAWSDLEWADGGAPLIRDGRITAVAKVSVAVRRGGRFTLPTKDRYTVRFRRAVTSYFDHQAYFDLHPDVANDGYYGASLARARKHYVDHGRKEGRPISLTSDIAELSISSSAAHPYDVDRSFNDITVAVLRSVTFVEPIQKTGLTVVGLRIRATGQLSGQLDTFNCVAQSKLPIWNGASWAAPVITSNPAWVFADILRGAAMARPVADSRIDLAGLLDWAAVNDEVPANGAGLNFTFNGIVDSPTTVGALLRDVAAVGRAAFRMVDSKFSVVLDAPQSVPVQHFTPRNIMSFSAKKQFIEIPHAFKVRFINPAKGYQQDQIIVYDDGYAEDSASLFETMTLSSVTNAEQAWRYGRYMIAAGRLRPETYILGVDIEALVCLSGDLVKVSHDVTRWGLGSARIKSISADGVGDVAAFTIDDVFEMESDADYEVTIRCADGVGLVVEVETVVGSNTTLTPSTPVNGPAIGDLVMFGKKGLSTINCIVKDIANRPDMTAEITLVDEAPGVHTAHTGPIPAFSTQSTFQSALIAPPLVSVILSQSAAAVAGAYAYTVTARWDADDPDAELSAFEVYRFQNGQFQLVDVLAANLSERAYDFTGLAVGEGVWVKVLAVTAAGAKRPVDSVGDARVTVTLAIPPDVAGFDGDVIDSDVRLRWDTDENTVAATYLVRYASVTSGAVWADSVDIESVQFPTRTARVSARTGTYLIKAIDGDGRESAAAAQVIVTVLALAEYTEISTQTEHAAFSGAKSQVLVNGLSDLQIDIPAYLDGIYDFANTVDLVEIYAVRITAALKTHIINNAVLFDSLAGNFDDQGGNFDDAGGANADTNVVIQIRTTLDNPSATPVWSVWRGLVLGDYVGRGFQFRVQMTTLDALFSPAIEELSVVLEVKSRTESDFNLTSAAGGDAVIFATPFRTTPSIAITAGDMASGDIIVRSGESRTGFTVQFKDSGGSGVARTYDWIANGAGAEQ